MPEAAAGFIFLRHGQTTSNALKVSSGGDRNPPLTEVGIKQAESAYRIMAEFGIKPSLILAAPLMRTENTARLISERMGGVELRLIPSLVERSLGEWNDQCSKDTNVRLSAGETPPGGESKESFRQRIMAGFQNDLLPLCAHWPLLVSSRGVARVLLESAGLDNAGNFPNGGLARLTLRNLARFEAVHTELLNLPAPEKKAECD